MQAANYSYCSALVGTSLSYKLCALLERFIQYDSITPISLSYIQSYIVASRDCSCRMQVEYCPSER